jgi:hypothetical protein
MENPFKEGCIQHHDFEVLSDLQWHCSKCELKAAQAKTVQTWRDKYGLQFKMDDTNENLYIYQYCKTCNRATVHRALATTTPVLQTKTRSSISTKLRARILKVLKYEEATNERELLSNELEVDHKFPQLRWKGDESPNPDTMSDEDIKEKFLLLTRSNNLLKSRKCERCKLTGIRGTYSEINFYYKGSKDWPIDIATTDKSGCVGCFWYDPYTWRQHINSCLNT